MLQRIRGLIAAACVLLCPALALAQATGTGTVTGRVTDSSGAVLPGVTVTLKSPQALGSFTAVSDAEGVYRISSITPATFEARAELEGFQPVVHAVAVRIGSTATVDFSLAVGALSESVQVSGEAPIVDRERTGLAVNVNNTALTSLPVSTSRRYQDIWALVPGVYVRPDQSDINPSVNSRGTSENSTKIDGMDVTDPYGGGVFSASFNYDAIQDIQVKTLGAEAEDGPRTGGFMSIVTKSGGNELHGSAALFVIPDSFNSTNVDNVAPNKRKDVQPDLTLGGPIMRDKIWFFGAYRRVQTDLTQNNAPVPQERRGHQWYMKVTTQLSPNHRLQGQFQWDRTTARNGIIRSSAIGATSGTSGISSLSPQQVAPDAFGSLITGGPLAGVNYTWVMKPTVLFQFVGSYMINKPQNAEPQSALGPTRIIQSNIVNSLPTNNIGGSLTTVAQEGNFGVVDTSDRSMLYLYPSLSFSLNKWGFHDFKVGSEIYPFQRNKTSREIAPVEFYFRQPGAADILFEQNTFRTNGGDAIVRNEATQRIFGGYFQDRWKPRQNISIKAGVRIDANKIQTKDRERVLGPALPAGFPTVTSDTEFDQTTVAPNFGIAYDAGKAGVFRGTAGRYYEWVDLGGGDGTAHFPYVHATDRFIAQPRDNAPRLNQSLLGSFPLGVNYGQGNVKTYTNEFSAGWERQLPGQSSFSVTFLLKRTQDFQASDDMNVARDPNTGALLGRPFPDYDAVLRTYAPGYSFQQYRSIQFLYTKNFADRWGMNANYWYAMHQAIQRSFNASRDMLQYQGFTPDEATNPWVSPRHQGRLSAFVRLPFDTMVSGVYSFTQGPKSDITTGDFALNAVAPRVTLSNGRVVADPFFNLAYPRAGRRGVDMLSADNTHLINLRLQKSLTIGRTQRAEFSLDVFNVTNSDAAFGFLSVDDRNANFGKPTNFVSARVAQIGVRYVF